MTPYLSEFIGTAVLVFLGNAVVANVLLRRTKGRDSGWIVIATGWAMAVFVGVVVAGASGAHLNPAVTIALWADGTFAANLVPGYLMAQMAGAMVGAFLVYLQFLPHWGITEDAGAKLACFSTGPGVRAPLSNMLAEALSTFVFVLAVLMLVDSPWAKSAGIHAPDAPAADPTLLWSMKVADGRWAPMVVAATFWGVGLGAGGTTGFAMNPARDLGPRLMHAILPIPEKGSSDWGYAWVPVVGPILGALLAVAVRMGLAHG